MPVSDRHCQVTLDRLKSLLHRHFPGRGRVPRTGARSSCGWTASFPDLFRHLLELYGHHFDFFYHLQSLLETMAAIWLERSPELKSMDVMREADRSWFQSGRLIGAMAYVDLFAGSIAKLQERIPYLQELGITYLHLMPLYRTPGRRRRRRLRGEQLPRARPRTRHHRGTRGARRRAAPPRHQPGPRLRLQPHLRRARVGPQGARTATRPARNTT